MQIGEETTLDMGQYLKLNDVHVHAATLSCVFVPLCLHFGAKGGRSPAQGQDAVGRGCRRCDGACLTTPGGPAVAGAFQCQASNGGSSWAWPCTPSTTTSTSRRASCPTRRPCRWRYWRYASSTRRYNIVAATLTVLAFLPHYDGVRGDQLKLVLARSLTIDITQPFTTWKLIADLVRPPLELPGDLFELNVRRVRSPAAAAAVNALANAARGAGAPASTRLPEMPGGPAETNAVRLLLGPTELFRYGGRTDAAPPSALRGEC